MAKELHLVHQHNLIKLVDPKEFDSVEHLNKWLEDLTVDVLKMQICLPARSVLISQEGNAGFTGQIGLVTSHIAVHTWPEDSYTQLDIYSCACYDMEDVYKYIKETLNPKKILCLEVDRQDESIYNKIF